MLSSGCFLTCPFLLHVFRFFHCNLGLVTVFTQTRGSLADQHSLPSSLWSSPFSFLLSISLFSILSLSLYHIHPGLPKNQSSPCIDKQCSISFSLSLFSLSSLFTSSTDSFPYLSWGSRLEYHYTYRRRSSNNMALILNFKTAYNV